MFFALSPKYKFVFSTIRGYASNSEGKIFQFEEDNNRESVLKLLSANSADEDSLIRDVIIWTEASLIIEITLRDITIYGMVNSFVFFTTKQ